MVATRWLASPWVQFELTRGPRSVNGPVSPHRLDALRDLAERPTSSIRRSVPGIPAVQERFAAPFRLLKKRDIPPHHPYQSFTPVLDRRARAAKDPKVVAIRRTPLIDL